VDWVTGTPLAGEFAHLPVQYATGRTHVFNGQTALEPSGATTYRPTGPSQSEANYLEVGRCTVFTYGILWPGLELYWPETELDADPLAIGWEHQGGSYWLDQERCYARGYQVAYDRWDYDAYVRWFNWQYEPFTTGEATMYVFSNQAWGGGTFVVGTPEACHVENDAVYVQDVMTTVTGSTLPVVYTGTEVTVPLPPRRTLAGWGECYPMAVRLSAIPGGYGMVGGSAYCQGQAVSRPWRLLYSPPSTTAPWLRQVQRPVGGRQWGRQAQVLR